MAAKRSRDGDADGGRTRRAPPRVELPIAAHREELQQAVSAHQVVIVLGETGCGKTTQLPQYLLERFGGRAPEADAAADRDDAVDKPPKRLFQVAVTQPRRVAAVSVARRVAQEQDCRLGSKVGYTIRFEDVTSAETQIKYMTDGILVRECLEDPLLRRYDIVVLDEAHERSLETDVLFGLLKLAVAQRKELKVVVMSATLDALKFSRYFYDCPVFTIAGRMFDVDVFYNKQMNPKDHRNTYIQSAFDAIMHVHCADIPGDVLCFMTGRGDIDDLVRRLHKANANLDYNNVRYADVRDMVVMPLYGALESELQQAIFDPPPRGCRKVVVATNIAATSVTIDGIRYVVDPGFVKEKSYETSTGMEALTIVPISKAAAVQRTGRAGRTATGKCYRLYSKEFYTEHMAEESVPEILRTSLTSTVLSLKRLGVDDVLSFEFMEPPETQRLVDALKQLFYLDALSADGQVTRIGESMSQLPLLPNLARCIIASVEEGCSAEMATIAAMLSVEDLFVHPRAQHQIEEATKAHSRFFDETGDHLTLISVFEGYSQNGYSSDWARDNFLHSRALKTAANIREQIADLIQTKLSARLESCWNASKAHYDKPRILRALCAGYYLHCARKHATMGVFYPAGLGRHSNLGLVPHPSSSFFESGRVDELDWVIFHEVVYTSKAFMRCVSTINGNWIVERLPKLSQADVSRLSRSQLALTDVDGAVASTAAVDGQAQTPQPDADAARARTEAIDEARKRYLERKAAKPHK